MLTNVQVHTLERMQKRACKIMLGNNYNSYIDECGIKTLSDRRQAHCLKFAQSLANCKQTENLIPTTRKDTHGRDLRNSQSISLLPCRTNRFRRSPVPYYIDLLNS